MRSPRLAYIVAALSFIFSLIVLPTLPNPTPTHWNVNGQVDGYGSPLVAAFLAPGIMLVMLVLRPLLPRLDPRRENYPAFAGTYGLIMNAVVLFLAVINVTTLGYSLGWPIDVSRVVLAGVGLLFALLGSELGRVQPNFFVGIRTPWTLADPEVWRQTHQVGGRLFVGCGLALLVSGLLLPPVVGFAVTMAAVVLIVGFSFGYSYWLWRRHAGQVR